MIWMNGKSFLISKGCAAHLLHTPFSLIEKYGEDMKNMFTALRTMGVSALMLTASAAFAQEGVVSVKVSGLDGAGKYYGKVSIPQGRKYKVVCEPEATATVRVYSAHIDGTSIYLKVVDHFMGAHWIDATGVGHNFIVRSTSADDVKFVPVTDAEDQVIENDDDYYYYDSGDARRNALKYTASKVTNETLRTSATYKDRPVYVMANPAKHGLAFLLLNPTVMSSDLAARSLYILGKAGTLAAAPARLNVIFEDEDEDLSTAIESVDNETVNDECSNGELFDLTGRKVSVSSVLPKGIYIRSGKRILYK